MKLIWGGRPSVERTKWRRGGPSWKGRVGELLKPNSRTENQQIIGFIALTRKLLNYLDYYLYFPPRTVG